MLLVPDPSIQRVRPPLSVRRHWIIWAGLASLALHVALLTVPLLWLRHPTAVLQVQAPPPTVQLVMSPPGSDHTAPTSNPTAKVVKAEPTAAPPPKPPAPENTAQPTPPTPAPSEIASAPEHPPAKEQSKQAPSPPEPKLTQQPFRLSLGALESDTNALVTGNIVVPPSPDIKFHNRKPDYPMEAVLRGEQGVVLLLVHVRADGLVRNVEVAESSGYRTLDDAARDTVRTWHFLPSVQEGQPVAAEVPVRIVYALDK